MAQCTNTPTASPARGKNNNEQSAGKSKRFKSFKAEVIATKLDAFYDTGRKEFLIRNAAGRWHPYNETQFKRTLRARGSQQRNPRTPLPRQPRT